MIRAHDLGDDSQLCQTCPISPCPIPNHRHFVAGSRPHFLKLLGRQNILPG